MRAIFGLLAVVIVLAWLGFELRSSHRQWARTCFTLAGFVFLMLAGAFFGLYGV